MEDFKKTSASPELKQEYADVKRELTAIKSALESRIDLAQGRLRALSVKLSDAGFSGQKMEEIYRADEALSRINSNIGRITIP